MEGSHVRFENLFSDFHEKFSDEKNLCITQKFTPGIQVIYVYCYCQKDFPVLEFLDFLLELQEKYNLLDCWSYLFARRLKNEDFDCDVNSVYQFMSRNKVD